MTALERLPALDPKSVDRYSSLWGGVVPPIDHAIGAAIRDYSWTIKAESALEDILRPRAGGTVQPSDPENNTVHTQIILTGHGETESSREGTAPGWFSKPLSPDGIALAASQTPRYDALVLCSDLPRAIEHAVRKYARHDLRALSDLEGLIGRWKELLAGGRGELPPSVHSGFVDLALRMGIIPTALLRAQYFGILDNRNGDSYHAVPRLQDLTPSELQLADGVVASNPEKLGEFLREVARKRGAHAEAEAARRRNMTRPVEGFLPEDVGETYLAFLDRSAHATIGMILRLAGEGLDMRSVEMIGHSGFMDIAEAYCASLPDGKSIHLSRTKTPNKRGQFMVLKFGKDGCWMNDPAPVRKCLEGTLAEIDEFQEHSHDPLVRKGKGIMQTGFYRLDMESPGTAPKKTPVPWSDVVHGEKGIYLINGPCGAGKTTCLLGIAHMLWKEGAENRARRFDPAVGGAHPEYIPVLVRLRKASASYSEIPRSVRDENPEVFRRLLAGSRDSGVKVLTDPDCVLSWRQESIREYRREGFRFVFLLDGLDEVADAYRADVIAAASQLSEIGAVMLSSRACSINSLGGDRGIQEIHIDPEEIIRRTPEYLEARIVDPESRSSFSEYLRRQGCDIRQNWLMVSILTKMYSSEPSMIDLKGRISTGEIIRAGIDMFIWDHALEKDPALFEGPTFRRNNGSQIGMPGVDEAGYNRLLKDYRGASGFVPKVAPAWNPDGSMDEPQFRILYHNLLEARKQGYLAKVMPVNQIIAAYMTVNDKPSISKEEADLLIAGKWSLRSELDFRSGKAKSRWMP